MSERVVGDLSYDELFGKVRPAAPAELTLEDFKWNVRACRVFRKLRIQTLAKLCNTTEAKLLSTRHCGPTTVSYINRQLYTRGLSLKAPTVKELNRKNGWTEERRKEQSDRAIALNKERRKGRWQRQTAKADGQAIARRRVQEQPEPQPEPQVASLTIQASVDMFAKQRQEIETMRAALAITNKGSLQLAEEYLEAMQGDLTSAIFILKMLRGETP